MRRPWRWLLVLGFSLAVSVPALAEPVGDLAMVEQAYAEVDPERTLELAQRAVERGGNGVRATTRLYFLLGVSAAALDRVEQARLAFTHLLALDPSLKLDRMLSPKVRDPYLEARARLEVDSDEPPLAVTLKGDARDLRLTLRDTLSVAAKVEVRQRRNPGGRFSLKRLEPSSSQRLQPAPGPGRQLEYSLRVLDRYGNVLLEQGTLTAPERLQLETTLVGSQGPAAHADRPSATPYYLTAGTLGGLGLLSGAGAAFFFVGREEAAKEWNSPDCELPGATRSQQCGDVDDRRRRSESLAVGLAAGSGALLVGSLVALLLAPGSPPPRVALAAREGDLRLTYRGDF